MSTKTFKTENRVLFRPSDFDAILGLNATGKTFLGYNVADQVSVAEFDELISALNLYFGADLFGDWNALERDFLDSVITDLAEFWWLTIAQTGRLGIGGFSCAVYPSVRLLGSLGDRSFKVLCFMLPPKTYHSRYRRKMIRLGGKFRGTLSQAEEICAWNRAWIDCGLPVFETTEVTLAPRQHISDVIADPVSPELPANWDCNFMTPHEYHYRQMEFWTSVFRDAAFLPTGCDTLTEAMPHFANYLSQVQMFKTVYGEADYLTFVGRNVFTEKGLCHD